MSTTSFNTPSRLHEADKAHLIEAQRIALKRGRAVALDTTARTVKLDSGEALAYDRLLIATGSSPATPTSWRSAAIRSALPMASAPRC